MLLYCKKDKGYFEEAPYAILPKVHPILGISTFQKFRTQMNAHIIMFDSGIMFIESLWPFCKIGRRETRIGTHLLKSQGASIGTHSRDELTRLFACGQCSGFKA